MRFGSVLLLLPLLLAPSARAAESPRPNAYGR